MEDSADPTFWNALILNSQCSATTYKFIESGSSWREVAGWKNKTNLHTFLSNGKTRQLYFQDRPTHNSRYLQTLLQSTRNIKSFQSSHQKTNSQLFKTRWYDETQEINRHPHAGSDQVRKYLPFIMTNTIFKTKMKQKPGQKP